MSRYEFVSDQIDDDIDDGEDDDNDEGSDLSDDFVLPRPSRRSRRRNGVDRVKRKPPPPRLPDFDDVRVGSLFRSKNPIVLNDRFVSLGAEPILNNRRISWVEPGRSVTMDTRIQYTETGVPGYFFCTVKQLFDWADMIIADPKKSPGED